MRILLVTPFLPAQDAEHGGGVYLGTLAAALAAKAELALVALVRPTEAKRLARRQAPFAKVYPVPFRERPGGRGRRQHQLRMLWQWRRLPLVAAKHWQPDMLHALAQARREFAPDVACVELAQMAQYLPYLRGLPTVFTDHEAGSPANSTTGLGRLGDRRDLRLWRRYIQQYYAAADLLQAVTAEDAAELQRLLGREVLVRPPVFPVPEGPADPASAPPRALFLGDYQHAPNADAAVRIAERLLPALRRGQPECELWLAGPHQQRIAALARLPGVRLLGYVERLPELFGSVRLLLAPLFLGGGFRVKSLAALAHGVPVVTNALGARGCSAPAAARQVCDDDAGLVAAALRWLQQPNEAGIAGAAAFAWSKANLSNDAVAALQRERLQRLLEQTR
jgi:polysaccharide biosynthesis protein PslH